MDKVKGYKGFDKDLKCLGFQFEAGKTYTHAMRKLLLCLWAEILCVLGFHFMHAASFLTGMEVAIPFMLAGGAMAVVVDWGTQ